MGDPSVPGARRTVEDGAATSELGASEAAVSARAAASTREALRATAGWAVPLQWVAILGSGGIALVLALTHRWRSYDWLFVLLCALYIANAVGFRRFSKRDVP